MKALPATAFLLIGIACGSATPQRDAGPERVAVQVGARPEIPSELDALARGRIDGDVAAWCRADFHAGQRGAFAVAVSNAAAGGRYVALEVDGRVSELAAYTGRPDLSCYTRADAETLDGSIRQSETIHGELKPQWNTTVVCGFTDDTTAQCWQYSPVDRTFVQVGGWTT
jgi:hypothetical protein